MTKLQPVRGTRDLLGDELARHRSILRIANDISALYGYLPIETPIFENTSVFTKPLGESSDIVGKEMYTFNDRGEESITLRPEGTAPVVRAIINAGLTQTLPQRRILQGPMFRYERPQKGRYRQLHQISIECVGIETYHGDVEVISMAHHLLNAIGLTDIVLHLNTLGDKESRLNYRNALVSYFDKYQGKLSDDSKKRLYKNPLRILDSKDPGDKDLCVDAPKLCDYLNTMSATFFDKICSALQTLGIKFKLDHSLVRGLDYYCHTVFEFKSADLGAQDTVLGGGRYDGLMEQMGGPAMPAVGWASGLDRLALLTEKLDISSKCPDACIIPISEAEETQALLCAQKLREAGNYIEVLIQGNIQKRLKTASKKEARFAIIIGENEIKSNTYSVKNLKTDANNEKKEQLLRLVEIIELMKVL